MCLYPKLIRNPKYKSTKKNGGNIPPVTDDRLTWVPIGCQQCIECKKQKARQWQTRLLEDIKTHTNGKFITLTLTDTDYTNLSKHFTSTDYNLDNDIATLAVRRFCERWRKQYQQSIRHWLVTEIGHKGTENIHLHGIIWTDKPTQIPTIWKYGYVWTGTYVNEQTVNYITKYVTKVDQKHPNFKSIILTSPGIGNNYAASYRDIKNQTIKTSTGHEMAMPIYWKNKIYTEEQREKQWLEKLDKQTRYVLGKKIDISKNEKSYKNNIKTARAKNKELGYGSNQKTQEQIEYERTKRIIQQKTREIKAKEKEHKKQQKIINQKRTPRRRGSNQKGLD